MADLARQHIADARPGASRRELGRAGGRLCCDRALVYAAQKRMLWGRVVGNFTTPPGQFIGHTPIGIG